MHTLEFNYRDNDLRVEVATPPAARLLINRINRASETRDEVPCRITLSSSVQTDYEWHEFVEAQIDFSADEIRLVLIANKAVLAEQTFKPGGA
ncbi:MAG: hypothetical protein VXA40_07975 [Gammaproteobacteria bacterium]|jgi:hypothetical protein